MTKADNTMTEGDRQSVICLSDQLVLRCMEKDGLSVRCGFDDYRSKPIRASGSLIKRSEDGKLIGNIMLRHLEKWKTN